MKMNRQRREISPLKNKQQAMFDHLPHNTTITNHCTRKRGRAIVSLSSLIGAAACIICFSSAAVSAHDVVNQNNIGKKKFINSGRNKKRDLSGAWDWNEDDLPLNEVNSKSYKAEKSKSGKNNESSSEWSSNWSPRSPRWSSPQKPTSAHPTPWKAAGLPTTSRPTSIPLPTTARPTAIPVPTTSRPTSAPTTSKPTPAGATSKPTSKMPTESPMSPTPQSPTSKPVDGDPTDAPTTLSSMVPSTHPSKNPSSEPTSYPSSMPSFDPSSGPSSMPSSLPSETPSSTPTSSSKPTPQYMPSASPTVSSQPTSSPSADPSFSPSANPSSSPSASPTASPVLTASPTVSLKPTTSQRTGRPTFSPTISQEPSWAERTRRPTFSPTISNEPTNADRTKRPTRSPVTASPTSVPLPTGSPTISPQTVSPTPPLVTDSREELKMELFGLEFLDLSQTALFQSRTAVYMEAFYNDSTNSTNILDLIKRQVTDMSVVINVVEQAPPDILGDFRGRTLQALRMNERRKLQNDVTEPCIGDALTITFNIELTYRTTDPSLELSDNVISFPFRTIPFRKDYLANYLKAGDGGAFDDLYCTSRVVFPGGETSAPTGAPTVPSTNGTTLSPTVPSTINGTLSPTTTAQPSIAPSGSVSSEPTLSKKPATPEPTSNVTSLSPTSSNVPTISGNTTLSPTISMPPSFVRSSLPSTITQEPLPATDLRMDMFGLTEKLAFDGVLLYNERTASYIESFYNDYNSTDGIRGQVLDVTATVEITDQFVPEEEPRIEDEFTIIRGPRQGHNENDKVNESDEDESYLPEYATFKKDNFINAKYRFDGDNIGKKKEKKQLKGTRTLQIDSCTGDRIELVFTVSLSYRLTNTSLVEEDIIAEPFSTFLRRRTYMEVYLKGSDTSPFDYLKGSDTGPFVVDLTCTGEVLFPSDGSPTSSPTSSPAPTVAGTSNETLAPTVAGTSNETLAPTVAGTSNETLAPTVAGTSNETLAPTVAGTSNETLAPTVAGTSNETLAPTVAGTSNETLAPTVAGTSNETLAPTVAGTSNETLAPTVAGTSNETLAPTVAGTSNETLAPTVAGTSNETLAPTVAGTSNETLAPTVAGTSNGTTEVKSNVGQDLFGIPNLDPISTDVYNIQTAAYISAFYEEDPFVSISATFVSVTDENIPVGPIEGSDCSEIDPLTVSFTIEMTYSTTNPVTTFDEIIKLPFSTVAFQDTFINDYLKANDANGGFAALQCVSGLIVPESPGTTSPTGTLVPSSSPTEYIDDLLNDIIRSGPLPERSCLDKVDPKLIDMSEEIEISFVYGVESAAADYFFLDELEGLILDFLQVSIMMCSERGEQIAPRVWKIDDQQDTAGVIRVRYPEIGEASTMSKCDPTLDHAKGCAVLSTKILVTSVGVPTSVVHRDVLMLLNDAFKEGAFVGIIPELILTAYVGPDPEEYQLQAQPATSSTSIQEGESQSSRVIALSFSLTVILIAGLIAWFSFPLVRQELVKGAVTCCTRRRQPEGVEENALIVYQGDRESTDDVQGSPQSR